MLSPRLFNIYGKYIMRSAMIDIQGRISKRGRKLNNLRFATLIARDEDEILQMLQHVETESRALGLEINIEKTKLMIMDRGNVLQPRS